MTRTASASSAFQRVRRRSGGKREEETSAIGVGKNVRAPAKLPGFAKDPPPG
jgi:hypothetical protein